MKQAVNIEELAIKAMRVLGEFFDTPTLRKDKEAASVARLAGSVVASWSRTRQTESSLEALRLMAARELSGPDAAKFRKHYLEAGGRSK